MRVAVILKGEIRGTPDHWRDLYAKLIAPNNADVFLYLSTYDKEYFNNYNAKDIQFYTLDDHKAVHYYPPLELFTIFKPVRAIFDKKKINMYRRDIFDSIDPSKIRPEDSYMTFHNTCCHLESWQRSTEMKMEYERENNFIYDTVISTRLDLNPQKIIIINSVPTSIFASYQNGNDALRDQIIGGPSLEMNVFVHVLNDIYILWQKYCSINNPIAQTEFYIALFLKNRGINVANADFSCIYLHQYNENNKLVNVNGLKRFPNLPHFIE